MEKLSLSIIIASIVSTEAAVSLDGFCKGVYLLTEEGNWAPLFPLDVCVNGLFPYEITSNHRIITNELYMI